MPIVSSVAFVFACLALPPQQDLRARLRPIVAPVRAVELRLDPSSGALTRAPLALAAASPLPVYDNTCPSGYHLPLSSAAATQGTQAEAVVDQGRVPSTASPFSAQCKPGSADSYAITRFQIGYCTSTGQPVSAVLRLWNARGTACPNVFGFTPDASVSLNGLPGSSAVAVQACYQVTIQLATPGFALRGGASNAANQRFAWSLQLPGTRGADGPLVAGNPALGGCAPCVGTLWERPSTSTNPGTGLGAVSNFHLEGFGGPSSCSNFGTAHFASFHLRLDAQDPLPAVPATFCDASDGAQQLCPCGASNPLAGCDTAQGSGVRLELVAQSLAASTATLRASGFPPATHPTAFLVRSTTLAAVPVPLQDGLRCVGTSGFAFLAATEAGAGVATHRIAHAAGAGTFYYQTWFRNLPASYCVTSGPGAGAGNLSNGRTLVW